MKPICSAAAVVTRNWLPFLAANAAGAHYVSYWSLSGIRSAGCWRLLTFINYSQRGHQVEGRRNAALRLRRFRSWIQRGLNAERRPPGLRRILAEYAFFA